MKKKIKQYIYSVLLIIMFIALSIVNIYLIIDKESYDAVLLYSLACFWFIFWICGIIFKVKFLNLIYKVFKKPMSKSMTMDLMGVSVVPEDVAYKTFNKMLNVSPYIYLLFLLIGIIWLVF